MLSQYKVKASETSHPLADEDLEQAHAESREIDHNQLAKQLDAIPAGAQHASLFHNFIYGVLQAIFYPALRYPQKEEKLHEGRKRVDITYNNGAQTGFFDELRINYRIPCPFIFVECKNYSSDPANPELDQLTGRFNSKRGKFGLLVCRQVQNKPLVLKRCKDALNDDKGCIFVLDDGDIKNLLQMRSERKIKEIQALMNGKMRDLLM